MSISRAQLRRRLDRNRLAVPMRQSIERYYAVGDESLVAFLKPKFDEIQSYFLARYPVKAMRIEATKGGKISPADLQFMIRLLAGFGQFKDAKDFASSVLKLQMKESYEKAARYALGKLGLSRVNFNLRNPNALAEIDARALTFPDSAQVHFEDSVESLTSQFIERGRAPYNSDFVRELKDDLGYTTNADAIRFARTETGIITSRANKTSYEQMGVEAKRWLATGGARPSHAALNNTVIGMNEKFSVGGHYADHPLDPSLPAEELINCRCDMAPDVKADYNPRQVWTGE